MVFGLIASLFSSVPANTASDAAPFTVARSSGSDDVVIYTVTGPKQETARAAAFALLGVPWLIGGLVMPFLRPPPATGAATGGPHPVAIAIVLLALGGLMCRQAYKRQWAASRRYQVEINPGTSDAVFTSTRSDEAVECNTPVIMICKTPDEKYHTLTIQHDGVSILLGMLRYRESAVMYADLLGQETGLPIGDATGFRRDNYDYHRRMIPSDQRALEKPVRTRALSVHKPAP